MFVGHFEFVLVGHFEVKQSLFGKLCLFMGAI